MGTAHNKHAVVLLSGGIDSAVAAAIAKSSGYVVHALFVDYGQRNKQEMVATARLLMSIPLTELRIVQVDLRPFGGTSALTTNTPVPKALDPKRAGIPITYVPARNTILLALATAYAESIGAEAIYIGSCGADQQGYPDCRPAFRDAFQQLINVATKRSVLGQSTTLVAPLVAMSKAQVIRTACAMGLDLSPTTSCYEPGFSGAACDKCDACQIRAAAFAEAGVADPASA